MTGCKRVATNRLMLRERPALRVSDFKNVAVRVETKRMVERLAKELHWNEYEVVHALVVAELDARKEPKP